MAEKLKRNDQKQVDVGEKLPALLGGEAAVRTPPPHSQWPMIGAEEESAVLRVLRRGELSYFRLAGVTQAFENAFARMHEMPLVLSTHSGTAALHAAYFGLNLAPGDTVIVPSYTHLGTALPMLHANLIPTLCDIDEANGNIDPDRIESLISTRTRAITVTHQYGHVCDMDRILEIAGRHQLYVIEDCSHAHGARYKGKLAGTFGDVGCFSLQAHKAVVAGEGGILVTRNPRIFERAAMLGHFRQKWPVTSPDNEPFIETGYGLKNRLHPLAAAIAAEQLKKLPEVNARRHERWEYFMAKVACIPGVEPLHVSPDVELGGFFRFLVRYRAEELCGLPIEDYIEALRAEGVAEVWPGSLAKPLHLNPLLQTPHDKMYSNGWPRLQHTARSQLYRPGDFPSAERFSAATLQFPAFTHESLAIIDEYCAGMTKLARHAEALKAYFSSAGSQCAT